jgi:putative ABC transport system permease protein
MIRFLLKGLIRDKSRSRLPIIVVAIGVMLSVFLHAYVTGIMGDMVEQTARFSDGHVKVMTKAYAKDASQIPNDLAMLGVDSLMRILKSTFPTMAWAERIRFGGLIDVPDAKGETKSQGPAIGMGIDLFSPDSKEVNRLNLKNSLVRGNIPRAPGEALLSEDFSQKLGVNPGEEVTFIGSTMYGEMAFYNFIVSGTLKFGTTALDRGTIVADLTDVQRALDMKDAAGEIVGFFPEGYYDDALTKPVIEKFKVTFPDNGDEYEPTMVRLRDQEGMSMYIDLAKSMGAIITFIFMIAMSLVLWNAGLLGGLRRYGEIGLRLALGEEKGHVYKTMLYESVMIGIAGTIVGTAFGLFFSWLLQKYGFSIGEFTKNSTSTVMMPNIVHARITAVDFYIGLVPGVISTFVGTALSGIGIYKRKTAQLFKELET